MKMKKLFSEIEIKNIEAAIVKAEQGSDGEIAPVFAKTSGNYHDAKYILGILISMIATAIAVNFSESILVIISSMILSVIFGVKLAGKFPVLSLPFITESEMKDEVNRRACEYFYSYNLGSTKRGSALLIYTSYFEHMTIVRTDLRSKNVVSTQELQEVCNLVTSGMKKKKAAEGLISAIEKYGDLLRKYFPNNSSSNPDELPNKIYLID